MLLKKGQFEAYFYSATFFSPPPHKLHHYMIRFKISIQTRFLVCQSVKQKYMNSALFFSSRLDYETNLYNLYSCQACELKNKTETTQNKQMEQDVILTLLTKSMPGKTNKQQGGWGKEQGKGQVEKSVYDGFDKR